MSSLFANDLIGGMMTKKFKKQYKNEINNIGRSNTMIEERKSPMEVPQEF